MTARWEYMILDVSVATFFGGAALKGDALTERLNQLGSEGWELVSTAAMQAGTGHTRSLVYTLKRARD